MVSHTNDSIQRTGGRILTDVQHETYQLLTEGVDMQQYSGHLSWSGKNYSSKCSWWAVSSLYTDTLSMGKWKGGERKEETVKECIIPTQLSITLPKIVQQLPFFI